MTVFPADDAFFVAEGLFFVADFFPAEDVFTARFLELRVLPRSSAVLSLRRALFFVAIPSPPE